jgi:hypothetical protein
MPRRTILVAVEWSTAEQEHDVFLEKTKVSLYNRYKFMEWRGSAKTNGLQL